jgi:hypothetical protein
VIYITTHFWNDLLINLFKLLNFDYPTFFPWYFFEYRFLPKDGNYNDIIIIHFID